jgi:dGTPase
MYTHASVKAIRGPAETVVTDLFTALHEAPAELPERWQDRLSREEEPWRARIIGDYVAGMTDRFAIKEHRRLTGDSPMPADAIF